MKKALLILLALVMVFSLAACGADNSGTSNTPSGGDSAKPVEISVANNIVPNGLDPLTEDAAHNYAITYCIYDRLVSCDVATNEWIPAIAKSWEQVDATTWKFDINLDYKFQNGEQLTMDDVLYSFERLKDFPKQADAVASVDSYKVDGTTFTVKFKTDSLVAPSRLITTTIIVNKAYCEANGDAAIYTNPIGTGPWKITEFTPGATATVETWEGYPFEKPQIDIIHFKAIAESSTRYVALETGDVQFIGYISALEYDLAKDNADLEVGNANSRRSFSICFNCEEGPFTNANLRKAISYAIDRESWSQLAGGQRVPITSMLFYGYDNLYAESSKMPTYDINKAKELLEAEGINPSNPLSLELICVEAEPGLDMYASILQPLGVNLNVTILEHSVYLQREGAGEFDICYPAQANRANTALTDLDRFDPDLIGSRVLARYTNARVKELIEAIRVEKDEAKIKEMAAEINDIVAEDCAWTSVFLSPMLFAFDKGLSGVTVDGFQTQNYRNATYNP